MFFIFEIVTEWKCQTNKIFQTEIRNENCEFRIQNSEIVIINVQDIYVLMFTLSYFLETLNTFHEKSIKIGILLQKIIVFYCNPLCKTWVNQ